MTSCHFRRCKKSQCMTAVQLHSACIAAGASLSVHHAWALHSVLRFVSHVSHGMHVSWQGHLLSHQCHAFHTGILEGGVDDEDEVVSGEAVSNYWEGKQNTGRAPIQQRTCTVRVISTTVAASKPLQSYTYCSNAIMTCYVM